MPIEAGYEQRVAPQPGAKPVLANPEDYGAGVGQSIEQAGDTGHAVAIRAYQIQRDLQADRDLTAASAKLAAAHVQQQAFTEASRDSMTDADVPGHLAAVKQHWDDLTAPIVEGISDQRTVNNIQRQLATTSAEQQLQEQAWLEGQQTATSLRNAHDTFNIGANHIGAQSNIPDVLKTWETQDQTSGNMVASINHVDMKGKAALADYYSQANAMAAGSRIAELDPTTARSLYDQGKFDAHLTPEQHIALGNKIDAEQKKKDNEAKSAAAAARTASSAEISLLEDRVNHGVIVPQDEILAVAARAKAAGQTDDALFKIKTAGITSSINDQYGKALPTDIAATILAIQEKPNKSDDDYIALKALTGKLGQAREAFNSDPVTKGGSMGLPVELFDWAKPAPGQVDNRVHQAYAMAAHGAALKPLTTDDVTQMRNEIANRGDIGRQEVMGQLDAIKDDDARAAAARQVAPDDKQFVHEGQILPDYRATLLRGKGVLSADPKFFAPDKTADPTGAVKLMVAKVDREMDVALKLMDPTDIAAIKKNAKQYVAGWLQGGGHTATAMSEGDYRNGMLVALGGKFSVARSEPGGISVVDQAAAANPIMAPGAFFEAPMAPGAFFEAPMAPGGGGAAPPAARVPATRIGDVGGLANWRSPGQPYALPDHMAAGDFERAVIADRAAQAQRGSGPVDRDGVTPFNLNNAKPVLFNPPPDLAKGPPGSVYYRWETQVGTVRNAKRQLYVTIIPPRPR